MTAVRAAVSSPNSPTEACSPPPEPCHPALGVQVSCLAAFPLFIPQQATYAPSTLWGAVLPRSRVANPRSPILTTPSPPLMKMLSDFRSLQVQPGTGGACPRLQALIVWDEVDWGCICCRQTFKGRRLRGSPVDDGGLVAMQVNKATQDLPCPVLEHL